jgi:hypothetical protein
MYNIINIINNKKRNKIIEFEKKKLYKKMEKKHTTVSSHRGGIEK